MLVSFALYKNGKILMVSSHYEYLEAFVEDLKELNKKWIDRRQFSIRSGNEVIKTWNKN